MTAHRTRRITALAASVALAVPLGMAVAQPASAAVSADTADMLQAIVAEEKLAHDVYTTLGDLYSVRTFDSIANAESRHQDALRSLMATHGVVDPTVGDAVGEFDDAAVQRLYDDLVSQGRESLEAAAQVGITIEKLDIADLDEALAADPPADVARVLASLRSGSEKHLAAFTRLAENGTAASAGQQQGSSQAGRGQGNGRFAQGRQVAGASGMNAQSQRDGSCLTAQ